MGSKSVLSLYDVLERLEREGKEKELKRLRSFILFLNKEGISGNVYVPQFLKRGRKLKGKRAKEFNQDILALVRETIAEGKPLNISPLAQKYGLDPKYVQDRARRIISSMIKIRNSHNGSSEQ